MSSATKTGPNAYMKAWKSSALSVAVFYAVSACSIIWFLSIQPTQGPVSLSGEFGCIDTLVPSTITGLSNIKLIKDVFKQGIERSLNLWGRTSLSGEMASECATFASDFKPGEIKNLPAAQEYGTVRNIVFSEKAREETADVKYEECRSEYLVDNPLTCGELKEQAAKVGDGPVATVDAIARRTCKAKSTQQSGGQTQTLTDKSLALAEDIKSIVDEGSKIVKAEERILGCSTEFKPLSITNILDHIDSLTHKALLYVKPSYLINQDHKLLSNEYSDPEQNIDIKLFTEPLRAPYENNESCSQYSMILSLMYSVFRPFIYLVYSIVFAFYLTYTFLKIPYSQFMNYIREFFSKEGTKMPGWKSTLEGIGLLLTQGTVSFWGALITSPIWIPFAAAVFMIGALFAHGPLAIVPMLHNKKKFSILYYAMITALVPSLLILAGQGRSYLSTKLPKHSELRTPVEAAWWIIGVLAAASGTRAFFLDARAEDAFGWRLAAWISLIIMVALPPISVAIDGAM